MRCYREIHGCVYCILPYITALHFKAPPRYPLIRKRYDLAEAKTKDKNRLSLELRAYWYKLGLSTSQARMYTAMLRRMPMPCYVRGVASWNDRSLHLAARTRTCGVVHIDLALRQTFKHEVGRSRIQSLRKRIGKDGTCTHVRGRGCRRQVS